MPKKLKRRILFISHEASRTGAPLLLLVLLRWLKTHSDLDLAIVLRRGGVLEKDFQAIAPTFIVDGGDKPSFPRRLLNKLRGRRSTWTARLWSAVDLPSISLIYSNTSTNGYLLSRLSGLGIPVITHVHELENSIVSCAGASFQKVVDCTDHYIACADAVKRDLIAYHSIPDSKVTVIHGFSQYATASAVAPPLVSRPNVARQLGVTSYDFLVGACGVADWRKGVDIFIQLAYRLRRRGKLAGLHFVWIGSTGDAEQCRRLQYDLVNSGLAGCVHFIGEVDYPWDWLRALDVFVLSSREDPFPLVCLEAASAGVPIICFDNAGGEPEFVEADCGFVVPYLDVEDMAARVEELLSSEGLRQTFGENAARKAVECYSVDVICRKVLDCISDMLR